MFDKIATCSEWIFVLNRSSAHWASELVLCSPVFEAVFVENMTAVQLSDWFSIVLDKIAHTNDAALLHFWVIWIESFLFEVYDSLNLRDSPDVSNGRRLLGHLELRSSHR